MAIDRIDVNVTSPGRNFVTVKVTTSDGVTGLGDATLNGRELSVASYLRDHVAPTLIGRDDMWPAWQHTTDEYVARAVAGAASSNNIRTIRSMRIPSADMAERI